MSVNRSSFRGSAGFRGLEPREIAPFLACSRRDFLRSTAGLALGSTLMRSSPFAFGASPKKRKVIVVTFGGGARDQETFALEGQDNIPNMLRELAPQSSFFTQVVNHGILGHYVATASLATGVYETLNNFSAVPPDPQYSNTSARICGVPSLMRGSLRPATASTGSAKAITAPTARAGERG
jgi:hypothetical protein